MHGPARIAVIGAGPSGLYATAALLASGEHVSVDVLDRLPAPYGLVRYGVAPDHVKMKSVIRVLQRPFAAGEGGVPPAGATPSVEFLGGVRVGDGGIPLDVLHEHVHAVVHATGSSVDRALGVPGEDLHGSLGSGSFVGWYCGHPDHVEPDPPLDAPAVAVIGAGNVALDVARVLARDPAEMAATDVPAPVLDALAASRVRDVHVFVRRGPEHVRFTPAELHQLGDLTGVDVLVHHDDLVPEALPEPEGHRERQVRDQLLEWAGGSRDSGGERPRRIHLRFHRRPLRILGENGRVTGIAVEGGAGREERFPVGLVVRAIGYAGEPVPGLPFDHASGTVPHEAGRVVRDGAPVPGSYVTGWLKRGPTGVIGTNKGDAQETVASLLADLSSLPAPAHPEPAALREAMSVHGVHPVDWTAWLRLGAEEIRRGGLRGADRVKVARMAEMLDAARGVPAP